MNDPKARAIAERAIAGSDYDTAKLFVALFPESQSPNYSEDLISGLLSEKLAAVMDNLAEEYSAQANALKKTNRSVDRDKLCDLQDKTRDAKDLSMRLRATEFKADYIKEVKAVLAVAAWAENGRCDV